MGDDGLNADTAVAAAAMSSGRNSMICIDGWIRAARTVMAMAMTSS